MLMDENKGRQVAKQMGLHLMGTVGMLRAAYDDKLLSYEDIVECVESWKMVKYRVSSSRH